MTISRAHWDPNSRDVLTTGDAALDELLAWLIHDYRSAGGSRCAGGGRMMSSISSGPDLALVQIGDRVDGLGASPAAGERPASARHLDREAGVRKADPDRPPVIFAVRDSARP